MSAPCLTSDTHVSEYDFVSIIIPVRNEAAYIVPSLQAMLVQDYDEPHHSNTPLPLRQAEASRGLGT
jgi:hypothetical protein